MKAVAISNRCPSLSIDSSSHEFCLSVPLVECISCSLRWSRAPAAENEFCFLIGRSPGIAGPFPMEAFGPSIPERSTPPGWTFFALKPGIHERHEQFANGSPAPGSLSSVAASRWRRVIRRF